MRYCFFFYIKARESEAREMTGGEEGNEEERRGEEQRLSGDERKKRHVKRKLINQGENR